jgi:hypothetical protein
VTNPKVGFLFLRGAFSGEMDGAATRCRERKIAKVDGIQQTQRCCGDRLELEAILDEGF